MSKSIRICIIAVCALLAAGLVAFLIVTALGSCSGSGAANYQTNIHTITEDFSDISIKTTTANVVFVYSPEEAGVEVGGSDGGKVVSGKVVCYEEEKAKHFVRVENGALVIELQDERAWYEQVGFNFETPKITVYLPKNEYSALKIAASTGSVEVGEKFKFSSADIALTTGSVKLLSEVSGNAKIASTTGNILVESKSCAGLELAATTGNITAGGVSVSGGVSLSLTTGKAELSDISCGSFSASGKTGNMRLSNVTADGKLSAELTTGGLVLTDISVGEAELKTSTGEISVTNAKIGGGVSSTVTTGKATFSGVSCGGFSSVGTTGSIKLIGVIASGKLSVERSTGGVTFDKSDAGEIFAKTTTGKVSGTLLSEKIIFASSKNGKISVPQSLSGGKCEIETTTGDINITIIG